LRPDLIGYIRNTRKRKLYRFRDQIYIFFICFLISVFLWILVRLSKNYYHTVHYDLQYSEIPSSLRLVGTSDNTLTLRIKVQGYDFFSEKYIKAGKKSYDLSLKGIKVRPVSDDMVRGYILTSSVASDIASQTSYPLEILSVSPDTLYFTFERPQGRKIPVSRPQVVPQVHVTVFPDSAKKSKDSLPGKNVTGEPVPKPPVPVKKGK
jgi:hypothetical protein